MENISHSKVCSKTSLTSVILRVLGNLWVGIDLFGQDTSHKYYWTSLIDKFVRSVNCISLLRPLTQSGSCLKHSCYSFFFLTKKYTRWFHVLIILILHFDIVINKKIKIKHYNRALLIMVAVKSSFFASGRL